jgi:inhibitor of cysteine peptidase
MRLMPLCLLASVLAWFTSSSLAAPVTITAADAARSIHLNVGEELVLKLENNPSTGYSWFLNEAKHPGLVSLGKPTYTDQASMPGAGGIEWWNFRAVDRGVQSLRFEYRRPWEKKPPVKRVDFLVVIR